MITFQTEARYTNTAWRCSAVHAALNGVKERKQGGKKREANSPNCLSNGLNVNVKSAIGFKLVSFRVCCTVVQVETADSENAFA